MNPFKWNVQNRQIHIKHIEKQKQRPKTDEWLTGTRRRRNGVWLLMSTGFFGDDKKNTQKLDSCDVYRSLNVLKIIDLYTLFFFHFFISWRLITLHDLYTLKGWTWWYVNYIAIKLLLKTILPRTLTRVGWGTIGHINSLGNLLASPGVGLASLDRMWRYVSSHALLWCLNLNPQESPI